LFEIIDEKGGIEAFKVITNLISQSEFNILSNLGFWCSPLFFDLFNF